jgi:mono/diheme cytochrome c family protein
MTTTDRPAPRGGHPLRALAIAGGVLALLPGETSGQEGGGAFFTAEQVARGDRVFTIECGGCHGPTMTDILAEADTAYRFYARISETMPWEAPGALTLQQYADIVAFLLSELGFPAGTEELPPERALLASIVPAEVPAPIAAAADAQPAEAGANNVAEIIATAADGPETPAAEGGAGYYTVAQADQGIRDFAIACGNCHGPDMVEIFQTYPTVGEYFSFITGAMPADNPGNLAPRQYLSVIAFLLRESGFPAGDTELTRDLELMRSLVPASPP